MQLLFYVNQTYIFLCCSTNLTFHVKLLFFTPTYFIHFLSWQSYFTEESLCDWNRYEIKLCFKIFVGAVFLSSSLSLRVTPGRPSRPPVKTSERRLNHLVRIEGNKRYVKKGRKLSCSKGKKSGLWRLWFLWKVRNLTIGKKSGFWCVLLTSRQEIWHYY